MPMKNEKGITLIVLVITVIVLGILISVTFTQINSLMKHVKLETVSTNLLLIQAKSKVIAEKANFSSDEALLKGEKVSEISGNTEIEALKTKGVISTTEENYDQYYLWDIIVLNEVELEITEMDEKAIYLVNYETEEVIYSAGYTHTDGNTYYKLSEILELE